MGVRPCFMSPPASASSTPAGVDLTSIRMRRLFVAAQRKKERQHFKDRKLLMHYEKQRAER